MIGSEQLIAVLELPVASRLQKRVPKKLLIERGAPTAGDKRKIQDGIEAVHWIASLKPANLNVQSFVDKRYDYSEIAILRAEFRDQAKVGRLLELIHRAIPYPVCIIGEQQGRVLFSLAVKRRSEAESGKFVLEHGVDSTGLLTPDKPPLGYDAFLQSFSVTEQSAQNLFTFYQSWTKRTLALQAATVKGTYRIDPGDAQCVRETLQSRGELLDEIAQLRNQAKKEKQINRQVELNLEIKALEAKLELTLDNL